MFAKLSVIALALVSAVSALSPASSGAGLAARDVPVVEAAHNVMRRDPVMHKEQVMVRARRLSELAKKQATDEILQLTGTVLTIVNANLTGVYEILGALDDTAKDVLNVVQTEVNVIVTLLNGVISDLTDLTNPSALLADLQAQLGAVIVFTEADVEKLLSDIIIDITKALNGVQTAVGNVPGVGPILTEAIAEIDAVVASLVTVVGLLTVVVLSVVAGLVNTVLGLLNNLGLVQILAVLQL